MTHYIKYDKSKNSAKYHKVLMSRFWEIIICVPFVLFCFYFISFISKYNSYNNYNNYHTACMHTLTTLQSTHAIIQLLHMINLKLCHYFTSVFQKKKKLNKVDYKVHLSISFSKLLYILSANIFFYFLLTVYFNL